MHKFRWLLVRVLPAWLAAMLSGCVIATPFAAPKNAVLKSDGNETAVLSLTHIVLSEDGGASELFWEHVRKVELSLQHQSGLIGYSLRREVFGKRAWTMTVWEDAQSVDRFMAGAVHRKAIAEAYGAAASARFVRTTIPRSELPVSWERAEKILEESGRGY